MLPVFRRTQGAFCCVFFELVPIKEVLNFGTAKTESGVF